MRRGAPKLLFGQARLDVGPDQSGDVSLVRPEAALRDVGLVPGQAMLRSSRRCSAQVPARSRASDAPWALLLRWWDTYRGTGAASRRS